MKSKARCLILFGGSFPPLSRMLAETNYITPFPLPSRQSYAMAKRKARKHLKTVMLQKVCPIYYFHACFYVIASFNTLILIKKVDGSIFLCYPKKERSTRDSVLPPDVQSPPTECQSAGWAIFLLSPFLFVEKVHKYVNYYLDNLKENHQEFI